jgi:hypothetical protein
MDGLQMRAHEAPPEIAGFFGVGLTFLRLPRLDLYASGLSVLDFAADGDDQHFPVGTAAKKHSHYPIHARQLVRWGCVPATDLVLGRWRPPFQPTIRG